MAPEHDLHARLMRGLVRLVRNVGSYADSHAALGSIVRDLVQELELEGAALWERNEAELALVSAAGTPLETGFARGALAQRRRAAGRMAWPLRVGARSLGVLAVCGEITEALASIVGMLAGRCAHILNDARRVNTQRGLLEGLSHELRAPLQSLLGHVDLLASGSFGALTEPQAEAVEAIAQSADKILAVTRDVLQVARMDSGREKTVLGDVVLAEVLRREVDAARPLAEQAGLDVRLECPADLELVTDGAKIGRIVTNLLSNAIKYTSRGRVTVRAGREGSAVYVEVADTGKGIPTGWQGKVFDEYVRVEASGEGSGLGLSITRRLAELLGGRLTLRSRPGAGTTVRLFLPT